MPRGVYKRNPALRPQSFATCKRCGIRFGPLDNLSRKFCGIECKIEAQKTGRKTIRKTIKKARSAQSLLRYHILAGHITRSSSCEHCGRSDKKIEAAHKDYDRALDVLWLCISCHRKYDRESPKGATFAARSES
jgi:hypothetical protein